MEEDDLQVDRAARDHELVDLASPGDGLLFGEQMIYRDVDVVFVGPLLDALGRPGGRFGVCLLPLRQIGVVNPIRCHQVADFAECIDLALQLVV